MVTSIDRHTIKISKYIDHQLQSYVKEVKSYVKDSTDLNEQHGKHSLRQRLFTHGCTFPIHEYSWQRRN